MLSNYRRDSNEGFHVLDDRELRGETRERRNVGTSRDEKRRRINWKRSPRFRRICRPSNSFACALNTFLAQRRRRRPVDKPTPVHLRVLCLPLAATLSIIFPTLKLLSHSLFQHLYYEIFVGMYRCTYIRLVGSFRPRSSV